MRCAFNTSNCTRGLELHHVIRQQVIRREVGSGEVERALGDPRNLVPVCRWHHERLTNRVVLLDPTMAPDVYAFARDYGLTEKLKRELTRPKVPA